MKTVVLEGTGGSNPSPSAFFLFQSFMYRNSTLLLAAFSAAFFINACQQPADKTAAPGTESSSASNTTAPRPEMLLYAVMVDQLNLREQASKAGKVIAQFPEGSFVIGSGEYSANKEEVTLRGVIYTEPYTKVTGTTAEPKNGWAFLGALQKVYAGTSASSPDLSTLTQLTTFLKSLNVKQIDSGKKAWDYVKSHFADTKGPLADAAYILLDQFLSRMEVEGEYYKPMEAIQWTPEDQESVYKYQFNYQKYPATRAFPANGFRLETAEGMVFPVADPMQLHAFFAPRATPEMKTYLDQELQIEQNEHAWEDGGIVIPMEQLMDRCVFWERFNQSNPNFVLSEETRHSEKWIGDTFISGANNTPAFDYETGAVSPEYLKVWAYALEKYPQTKIAARIKEFTALIAAEGNKRTPKVEAYISKLIQSE